jgi:hypothetical protein
MGVRVTIGSHQRTVGKSQTHLTPKWLLDKLGQFDTDPCAADPRPWDCARYSNIPESFNGLLQPWQGRVWLNPPFDRYQVADWVRKLAHHGDGIALLRARTETEWFKPVWERAHGLLFLADRIKFCLPDGTEQPANSGAPVVLCAFGRRNVECLHRSGIPGALVTGWSQQ